MASYSSGLLEDIVEIFNRKDPMPDKFGKDSAGHTWESAGCVHANIEWARGKQAMNAGSLDVYGVIMIRMRWNSHITERSRIGHGSKMYQILGETFHADRRDNTIQFHAQIIVNDKHL